jgi:hypothetical protein
MSEEVYENLSAKEIAKILKEKIEGRHLFKVKFVSDIKMQIDIIYSVRRRQFTLSIERSIYGKLADKEEVNVNIPDQFIHGDGTIFITMTDIITGVSAYSNTIKVWREKVTPTSTYTALSIYGE